MSLVLSKLLISSIINARLCHLKYITILNLGDVRKTQIHSTMNSETRNIFGGILDRFNGVTVDSERENCDIANLPQKLKVISEHFTDSLDEWKKTSKRGIWFKINLTQAEWVPILAKNGFQFHHALNDFVVMYKWLLENETCNIPQYAHTMIGVGAVVVNTKKQVLVVSEKYYNIPHWKLPGGYVEPGENLVDAAMREVYEETNIQTEFDSLISLRHTHNAMFNCSDMYTILSLKPLSENIEKCEREIAECKWMDIDEYLEHPHVHELNRFFVHKYLDYLKNNIKVECTHGIHEILKKTYTLYHVENENKTA